MNKFTQMVVTVFIPKNEIPLKYYKLKFDPCQSLTIDTIKITRENPGESV